MAIPLSQVARLEEFPRTRLEQLGTRSVVQYRGEILSLIDVSQALEHLEPNGTPRPPDLVSFAETVPVVVYAEANCQVGLIVNQILDIVAEPGAAHSPNGRRGIVATVVVQEKVTEIVDVPALLATLEGR